MTAAIMRDRDGDRWREAEDGRWCCLERCPAHGNVPHEDCAEHDHWHLETLTAAFGPLVREES